jgi:hypothetical protein
LKAWFFPAAILILLRYCQYISSDTLPADSEKPKKLTGFVIFFGFISYGKITGYDGRCYGLGGATFKIIMPYD